MGQEIPDTKYIVELLPPSDYAFLCIHLSEFTITPKRNKWICLKNFMWVSSEERKM